MAIPTNFKRSVSGQNFSHIMNDVVVLRMRKRDVVFVSITILHKCFGDPLSALPYILQLKKRVNYHNLLRRQTRI